LKKRHSNNSVEQEQDSSSEWVKEYKICTSHKNMNAFGDAWLIDSDANSHLAH